MPYVIRPPTQRVRELSWQLRSAIQPWAFKTLLAETTCVKGRQCIGTQCLVVRRCLRSGVLMSGLSTVLNISRVAAHPAAHPIPRSRHALYWSIRISNSSDSRGHHNPQNTTPHGFQSITQTSPHHSNQPDVPHNPEDTVEDCSVPPDHISRLHRGEAGELVIHPHPHPRPYTTNAREHLHYRAWSSPNNSPSTPILGRDSNGLVRPMESSRVWRHDLLPRVGCTWVELWGRENHPHTP